MEKNLTELLNIAIEKSKEQGYLTFDNLLDIALDNNLSLSEADKFSNLILSKGIIVYEEKPVWEA